MMIASAKADMHKGIEWYKKRHMGSIGITASQEAINQAIEYFSNEIQKPEFEKDAALYLLKSYYYKAEFAIQDKDTKKKYLTKVRNSEKNILRNSQIYLLFDTGIW